MLFSCYGKPDSEDVEDADAAETAKDGLKVITFQPGRIGIQADWVTGIITEVVPGGSAERFGVKEDWVLLCVDEKPYSKDLLRAKSNGKEPFSVTFRTRSPGRAMMHYNKAWDAQNVWTLPIAKEVVQEAAQIYTDEVMPEYMSLAPSMPSMPARKCWPFKTASGNSFCVTRSDLKTSFSDLVWISVDDEATYRRFEHLFYRSGAADYFMPWVDHDQGLRLFAIEFMTRSVAREPAFHCDNRPWVGTDCLKLILPITPRPERCHGLNLLYKSLDGEVHTYTYTNGEAIVFGSEFWHSTEPGESEEPITFLVFTFGTDRPELWPYIARTVGLPRRFMCNASGQFEETSTAQRHELDEILRKLPSSTSSCALL